MSGDCTGLMIAISKRMYLDEQSGKDFPFSGLFIDDLKNTTRPDLVARAVVIDKSDKAEGSLDLVA